MLMLVLMMFAVWFRKKNQQQPIQSNWTIPHVELNWKTKWNVSQFNCLSVYIKTWINHTYRKKMLSIYNRTIENVIIWCVVRRTTRAATQTTKANDDFVLSANKWVFCMVHSVYCPLECAKSLHVVTEFMRTVFFSCFTHLNSSGWRASFNKYFHWFGCVAQWIYFLFKF